MMLGSVLRSQALGLTRISPQRALARSISSAFVTARALPSPICRTFTSTRVSFERWDDDRRGFQATTGGGFNSTTRPKNEPTETLFVGNLPFTTVKEQLDDMFADYGTLVSVRLATRPDGEFRGFAHVEYTDTASAGKAMRAHKENTIYLDGRQLVLDYAAARAKPVNPPSSSIYVGNFNGDEGLLEETLQEFKDVIQEIKIMRNPQTNASYRYGFVRCATVEDATQIVNKWNGKESTSGETLELSYARPRNEVPRFTSYGRGQDRARGGYGDDSGRSYARRGDFRGLQNSRGDEQGYHSRHN